MHCQPKNMKKVISIIITVYVSCSFINCGNRPTNEQSIVSDNSDDDSTALTADEHTSANSLSWNGIYKGITPCADCEGIDTEVILNEDNTYVIKTKYIGKGDGLEEKGNFTWNKEGNTVTLIGLKDRPNQYFVGENRIIQLDMAGNKITGELADRYILVKQ